MRWDLLSADLRNRSISAPATWPELREHGIAEKLKVFGDDAGTGKSQGDLSVADLEVASVHNNGCCRVAKVDLDALEAGVMKV